MEMLPRIGSLMLVSLEEDPWISIFLADVPLYRRGKETPPLTYQSHRMAQLMHHIHDRGLSIPLPGSWHKMSKLQRVPPRVLTTVIVPRRRQRISLLPVESLIAIARRIGNDKRVLPHTVVADLLVTVIERDCERCERVEGMRPAGDGLEIAN